MDTKKARGSRVFTLEPLAFKQPIRAVISKPYSGRKHKQTSQQTLKKNNVSLRTISTSQLHGNSPRPY
ncbi:hypothetical protein, partial [Rothia endophytica]|uniref:hypothetical protein n=1 Tax=Rothia endophytica TaxID=1324766 RepID=UPI0031EF94D2